MSVYNMKEASMRKIEQNIVACLKSYSIDIIYLSDDEIYERLEQDVGYTPGHMSKVAKRVRGETLYDCITHQRYIVILAHIPFEEFEKLSKKATICSIYSFKKKCLRMFPYLDNKNEYENLQRQYLDEVI